VQKVDSNLIYIDGKGGKQVAYIDLIMAKIARLEERIKELEG
jgi:hypothetical protein